ncbi:MAG TPA: transglycosylase SLT domain-containing protein [Blastocatellia bacterium]|nr:transglycosylase SLT domain-containing protein [Blastocatellia bacterium]
MIIRTSNTWRSVWLVAVSMALVGAWAACGKKQVTSENKNSEPARASETAQSSPAQPETAQSSPAQPEAAQSSPAQTEAAQPTAMDPSLLEHIRKRWTGDLKGMIERRYIRALVTYNRTYYFYDGAQARAISYEALREFEKFLNQKFNTGEQPVNIVFIPVQRGEMAKALTEGRGDIAVGNIAILSEGKAVVDYSDPVRENANEIIVTGPNAPTLNSLDDLGGKEVYVRKNSRYWVSMTHFNEKMKRDGKPQAILKAADDDLDDEDILEMVNAGIVGITVVDSLVGELWAKLFQGVTLHPDLTVATNVNTGWAFRKNSPEFAAAINEFVKDHKVGTAFGNTLMRRYFQNPKWIANSTSEEEVKKFKSAVEFFKKYANQYGFDWLMVAAQGYQESRLEQSAKSSAGAVGVMQIKPSTAAGNPININDVDAIEPNIHAGVKYMRFMIDQYFKHAPMDRMNKGLFAFASYNAGPNRIAKLRKEAQEEGLDPNKWFNNVELVAGREIGRETVTYVSNIYKYYVAFKLVSERESAKKAKSS